MDSVYDNRDRFGEGGMLSQWKELRTPSNRKRVAIGVAIFVFMQFCGSNAINYYRYVHYPRTMQYKMML